MRPAFEAKDVFILRLIKLSYYLIIMVNNLSEKITSITISSKLFRVLRFWDT